MQVRETITVLAVGNQIRHGIYREFPTRYRDAFNDRYVAGFQMLSATRDSASETFCVENYSNGKRIYLGNPNTTVPPGQHVYTLTYATNRQLVFSRTTTNFSGMSLAPDGIPDRAGVRHGSSSLRHSSG